MIIPDLESVHRFLAVRAAPNVLCIGVTGAHLYGFPSSDSDLDLKGVHVAPTAELVSLTPPADTVNFLGQFEGCEIDYTSHELGFVLRALLKGNGNMLERILSPLQIVETRLATELQQHAQDAISRRFYHHYRGFFQRTREEFETATRKTAKGLLYAYRTALTGVHLLRTGECVGNVLELAPDYGFRRVAALAEWKRSGSESGEVADPRPYQADWERLETLLREAFETSPLPDEARTGNELSAFLVEQRRRCFE